MMIFQKYAAILAAIIFGAVSVSAADKYDGRPVIACLGDSITFGVGSGNRLLASYPSQLGEMLGGGFAVKNFGANGTTFGYWAALGENRFQSIADANPSKIVILLGTNDSKTGAAKALPKLEANFESLIARLNALASKPAIFIALPPPAFENKYSIQGKVVKEEVIPRIKAIASKLNLPLIDTNTPFANDPKYFADGVHPDSEGAKLIAQSISKRLLEGY